jgi:hypothetical protein
MIVYFPGSFKPPHRGHFSIIDTLLKNKLISKIYILISKKSRMCSLKNSKIEFTADHSKKIWNFYITHCIPEYLRNKIIVKISYFPSPIYQMFYDIQQQLKKKDAKNAKIKNSVGRNKKYIIVKSAKNISNQRFNILSKLEKQSKNVQFTYKVVKTFRNLSASDFRCFIEAAIRGSRKDRDKMVEYYPACLKKSDIKNYEKILMNFIGSK